MKSYRAHNSFLDLAKTSARPESQNPAGIEPGSVASRRLARAAALAQRVDAHLKYKLNTSEILTGIAKGHNSLEQLRCDNQQRKSRQIKATNEFQ